MLAHDTCEYSFVPRSLNLIVSDKIGDMKNDLIFLVTYFPIWIKLNAKEILDGAHALKEVYLLID